MPSTSDMDRLCSEARQRIRKGDYPQAIKLFKQVLQSQPDRADAHQGLGTAYFHQQEYDAAIEHFTRWMQLKPMESKPYINLGAVYNRVGEHQKAADTLRRAIQKDAKSAEAYYNLGIAHRKLDQLGMAMNAYKEAIRLKPEHVDAHLNLANVYLEMKNFQKATSHYEKALELKPGFQRALRGLKKAKENASESIHNFSPFGRLVDADALEQRAAEGNYRELSPKERIEDRQTILRLMSEILFAAQEWLSQMREELEPTLLTLNRELSHGEEISPSLFTVQERFSRALERTRQLRTRLKNKLALLREHEQGMKS